mmetsp:Transcript_7652/g.12891  ORF Transcript_7652/g.12891 Transcript_7652/m.12891 type:complete len:153 (+) Transcript_7652:284-742(+)
MLRFNFGQSVCVIFMTTNRSELGKNNAFVTTIRESYRPAKMTPQIWFQIQNHLKCWMRYPSIKVIVKICPIRIDQCLVSKEMDELPICLQSGYPSPKQLTLSMSQAYTSIDGVQIVCCCFSIHSDSLRKYSTPQALTVCCFCLETCGEYEIS